MNTTSEPSYSWGWGKKRSGICEGSEINLEQKRDGTEKILGSYIEINFNGVFIEFRGI